MLAGLAASLAFGTRARAQESPEEREDLRNLRVRDLREDGRRFLLVSPRWAQPDQAFPIAVLLHGLGETGDPRLGAYAWLDRYGLGEAWQRLKRAPIARTSRRGEWTDARLAEVNGQLAARPFRGFAIATPHMPNPRGPAEIDAYAAWIERALLPRVRAEIRTLEGPEHTYLGGVSLGGFVGLEVLVRLPGVFGAFAGVQTAIGAWAARRYAEKVAPARRPLLLLTSAQDHFRSSSEALSAELATRGAPHELRVLPGPHDQPWLREAGTIETLLWLDRLA